MKEYRDFWKRCDYSVAKIELLQATPAVRKIEGVTMILDEENLKIKIIFEKRSKMLATSFLMYEIADPALEIKSISFNNKNLEWKNLNEDVIIENIFNFLEENNIFEIEVTRESLNYEFGCVLYKELQGKFPDKFLNELIDGWYKDRLI